MILVGLVGIPVIGGGFGLNLATEFDCDVFTFDVLLKLTGDDPCEDVDPSADEGDEVIERFEGEGDLDEGRSIGRMRLAFVVVPLLAFVPSLSAPPSEQSDSLSISLLLFFPFELLLLELLFELLQDKSVGSIDTCE